MLDELARRTGVQSEQLHSLADNAQRSSRARQPGGAAARSAQHPAQRRTAGLSLIERAIALLLRDPDLVNKTESVGELANLDEAGVGLFIELCETLKRAPDTSLGRLLGFWYGSPEGSLLARLAAIEMAGDPATLEQEFCDLVDTLGQRVAGLQADALRRELEKIPFEEMSTQQKDRYRQLLLQGRGQ